MYYKLVGVNGGGLQTATGFGINSKSPFAPFAVDNNINLRGRKYHWWEQEQ
jgi:hypothetical protein